MGWRCQLGTREGAELGGCGGWGGDAIRSSGS